MEKKKIKRLYIMPEVWVTVTQSQVFNWISIVNQNGISTDCLSITTKKHNKKEVKEIENSIGGSFIEIHDNKRLIVNDIYLSFNLLKYYFTNIFKYKKIIFQTRMTSSGLSYAILNWLPRSKFIFEARGASNEQRKDADKGKEKTFRKRIKNFFSETDEKLVVKKSDRILCVSNSLKDYYWHKFNLKDKKFTVFPGAADSDLFFYNEKLRNKTRLELALNTSDILIVYSGRLEMKWEIPNKIFSFFKKLNSKNFNFKLLIVTPDVDIAFKLIKYYKFEEIVSVKKVDLKDVNKYLNSADVGLLLREDIPLNNVASPTKFAEYLMSGLPVIISSGVHDFANMTNRTEFGVVVSEIDDISFEEFEILLKSLKIKKSKIALWGLQNLSKESFIKKYVKMLIEI